MALLKSTLQDFPEWIKTVHGFNDLLLDLKEIRPELSTAHTIINDIKGKQVVGYFERPTKIVKNDKGCSEEFTDFNLKGTQKMWDPNSIEVAIEQCYTDLEGKFWHWSASNGIKRADLTQDDAINFITMLLQEGIADDVFRKVWFDNKDITAEELTHKDKDVENYNTLNGFWNLIFEIMQNNPNQKADTGLTTANDQATYLEQKNKVLGRDVDGTIALKTFESLAETVDNRIFNATPVIFCTDEIYKSYKRYFRDKSTDSAFNTTLNGLSRVAFDNIPIVPVHLWSRVINNDFMIEGKAFNPHRAIITTVENLQIGFDNENSIQDLEYEYEVKSKNVYMRSMAKIDAQISRDQLVTAAY